MPENHWSKIWKTTPYVLSVLRLLAIPALGILLLQCLSCYQQNFDNSVFYNAHWFKAIGIRFIWNYLLLLIPYLILFALPFFRISSIVMSAVVLVFGLAEHYTILYRNIIIFPWDLTNLSLVAKVSGTYDFVFTKEVLLALLFFALMAGLAFLGKEIKFRIWMRAAMIVIVCVSTFFYMNLFVLNRDAQLKSKITFYYTLVNYNYSNGVLLNFCYNLRFLYHEAPDGYSAQAAQKILSSYDSDTVSIVPNEEQPDVIMIMSEAFSDLRNISDFDTNYPVMPSWDALSGNNVIKKTLLTSEFGGNTANAEFEVLTGLSMKFFPSGTYPFKQYIREKVNSLASILKENGYETLAVHPFDKTGWNRENVMPLLGFDQFLGEEVFDKDATRYRGFISDMEAYQYIIDAYTKHKETDPATPLFEYLISIQNHGGYKKTTGFLYNIVPDLPTEYPQANQYLSLLHISDNALNMLISYFENIDHPTVIILFGDHLPALTDGFLDTLKTAADANGSTNIMSRYETQLLVWANYDISDSDLGKLTESYISNNYVSTYLSDILGIQRTPLQQFLFEMHNDIPAISSNYVVDSNGNIYRSSDTTLPEKLKSWLKQYEILQYYELYDSEE